MQALDIDFHRPPRPSALGWLLLAVGLAALAALLAAHRHWADGSERLQATLYSLESRLPRPTPAKSNGKNDEALTAARLALEKSRMPWGSLFKALESADNPDVALLAVTPEASRGLLKIHAEARDLSAMLAYHRRLEQEPVLRQVTLVDHETGGEAGVTRVRFHISAAWGPDHGHP
ncbi:MAG: pilus assembly protein [Actinomycetota bacterium]